MTLIQKILKSLRVIRVTQSKDLVTKDSSGQIVNKEYIEIYWNNKNRLCACYL